MFKEMKEINSRPSPFQFYTADELWTNEHTSKQMLEYHLNEAIDVSSRNKIFIERSVEWIVSHFGVDNRTEIADFGCGPGLYTTRLAERGAIVTGIDFSENSLKYAKQAADKKGLRINYVHENYLDFETPDSFDLITMIMCDFCTLSPEQRSNMLSKFELVPKLYGISFFHVELEEIGSNSWTCGNVENCGAVIQMIVGKSSTFPSGCGKRVGGLSIHGFSTGASIMTFPQGMRIFGIDAA